MIDLSEEQTEEGVRETRRKLKELVKVHSDNSFLLKTGNHEYRMTALASDVRYCMRQCGGSRWLKTTVRKKTQCIVCVKAGKLRVHHHGPPG